MTTYDEASATFYLPSSCQRTANESLSSMAVFDTEMFITAERAPSWEFKNRIIQISSMKSLSPYKGRPMWFCESESRVKVMDVWRRGGGPFMEFLLCDFKQQKNRRLCRLALVWWRNGSTVGKIWRCNSRQYLDKRERVRRFCCTLPRSNDIITTFYFVIGPVALVQLLLR